MNFQQFIHTLRNAGLDVGVEEIRDALWLATQLKSKAIYPAGTHVQESKKSPLTPGVQPPIGTPTKQPDTQKKTAKEERAPASSPPASPVTEVRHSPTPIYQLGQPKISEKTRTASPIAVPAGKALAGPLAISRALQPFRRRWQSAWREEIDEEFTVDATAEHGFLFPMFRFQRERWFDAEIVLEADPGIALWRDVLVEYKQLLVDTGAFRQVQLWNLLLPPRGLANKGKSALLETLNGVQRMAQSLADSGTRKLIFFVTHGSSSRWSAGAYAEILEKWSRRCSVVLLHVLPEHRWKNTALGEPQGTCRSLHAGVPATRLEYEPFWWAVSTEKNCAENLRLPVTTLNASVMGEWARMQMARGGRSQMFELAAERFKEHQPAPLIPDAATHFERAAALLREVSLDAFKLGVFLSSGPFTIPVARLIQETEFGEDARPEDLAEFLLSGLAFVRSERLLGLDASNVYFDCYEGARAVLQRSLRDADARTIVDSLEKHISQFIERSRGRSLTFDALVADEQGKFDLPEWAQPFARMRASLIQDAIANSNIKKAPAKQVDPKTLAQFVGIKRFVVLTMENRSFDHLFGYLKNQNAKIAGLTGQEFNQRDPSSPSDSPIKVRRSSSFGMTFDPCHEYHDVQVQLYGLLKDAPTDLPPIANVPTDPAPMTGFISSAVEGVDFSGDENFVMDCFQPDQLPVLSTLANEFALFNFWYSSLPGPTWPNRFFIHAATSGGLTESPSAAEILAGFSFENGTIYDRLREGNKTWCIYHDGLPHSAGISNLRREYTSPYTQNFRDLDAFFEEVASGELADYVFIEPFYDAGNNYLDGNSMHPLNDIRRGEVFVKKVYEALRNSTYWTDTMLVITFAEHGGFYDHQPPAAAVPPGDEVRYANSNYQFLFSRLGVRVPAIVISAYTARGTIIGTDAGDPSTIFDHTSVLATVEKLFGLPPLTKRDAVANTLEVALNQATARTDALTALPDPAPDTAVSGQSDASLAAAGQDKAALSANQTSMLALALACDLEVTPAEYHAALIANHQKLIEQKDAADYIGTVERKIAARRQPRSSSRFVAAEAARVSADNA